jgi:hypothetical protein
MEVASRFALHLLASTVVAYDLEQVAIVR